MTPPRWTVGAATITAVHELDLEGVGPWLLPDATPELVGNTAWLDPSAADTDGGVRVGVQSLVVEIGDTRIVVDTGVGNGKTRTNPAWNHLDTAFAQSFTTAIGPVDGIDLVVNTHLHRDHVGWNTTRSGAGWVPMFPQARYLVSREEWAHWQSVALDEDQRRMMDDSVMPVRDNLDLVDVEDRVEIFDGVSLLATPGHTPGHCSVLVESEGRSAIITGDALHHPVQIAHPCVGCGLDVDRALADRTRRGLLDLVVDTETLVIGTHFTAPIGGWVRRHDDGMRLESSADGQRAG